MKCAECRNPILATFANMAHFRVEWEGNKPWRETTTPAMMKADLCSFTCVARWGANRNAEMGKRLVQA